VLNNTNYATEIGYLNALHRTVDIGAHQILTWCVYSDLRFREPSDIPGFQDLWFVGRASSAAKAMPSTLDKENNLVYICRTVLLSNRRNYLCFFLLLKGCTGTSMIGYFVEETGLECFKEIRGVYCYLHLLH
jgi:hypothetical protein